MSEVNKQQGLMEKLTALAKRRGFIFQSSEIYGGINGFWDYGPLGVELKRNIKDAWWQDMVTSRDDMVGLDCSIIMNPKVWEASGHVGGFTDPMVDCKQCKGRFRADKVWALKAQSKAGVQVIGVEADDEPHAREAAAPALAKIAKKQGSADVIEVLVANVTLQQPDLAAVFVPESRVRSLRTNVALPLDDFHRRDVPGRPLFVSAIAPNRSNAPGGRAHESCGLPRSFQRRGSVPQCRTACRQVAAVPAVARANSTLGGPDERERRVREAAVLPDRKGSLALLGMTTIRGSLVFWPR